jgi:prophage regulatory protein
MRALRILDVVAKVGLKRSTIYSLAKQGLFPRPIKLSSHASAWLENQVEEWLTERATATRLKVVLNLPNSESPKPTAPGNLDVKGKRRS